MGATIANTLQCSRICIDSKKCARKRGVLVRFWQGLKEQQRLPTLKSTHLQRTRSENRHRWVSLDVCCSYNNFPASTFESEGFHTSLDEALKNKSQEIEPYLNGHCIYLVGMMGSGKTTVGKILSQVLGYSFLDSDILVEQAVGATSVTEIFELYGEGFFRDKETEVLRKLSIMHGQVVSTGGGAVIRPINWIYMHKGVSVWLDVPLETLAQRIAAVGTDSRPLLHDESGDAYTKAFRRLSTLYEERGEAYANANARVCLESVAAKLGYRDALILTPAAIAMEALEQVGNFLQE